MAYCQYDAKIIQKIQPALNFGLFFYKTNEYNMNINACKNSWNLHN